MQCDMCGTNTASYRAEIEGTEMAVCEDCSRFGKIINRIKIGVDLKPKKKPLTVSRPVRKAAVVVKEPEEIIVADYPMILRRKREQLGMTQKEFASMLAERETIIRKIEAGLFEPSIKTARKFEKMLKVRLIEEYEEKNEIKGSSGEPDQFTIGDLVTVRKRF